MECPNNYYIVQISDEGNMDEIDKFLVICQNFPTKYFYYLQLMWHHGQYCQYFLSNFSQLVTNSSILPSSEICAMRYVHDYH